MKPTMPAVTFGCLVLSTFMTVRSILDGSGSFYLNALVSALNASAFVYTCLLFLADALGQRDPRKDENQSGHAQSGK